MTQGKRLTLHTIAQKLAEFCSYIEQIKDEEQDKLCEVPRGLRHAAYKETLNGRIEDLTAAADHVVSAKEYLLQIAEN